MRNIYAGETNDSANTATRAVRHDCKNQLLQQPNHSGDCNGDIQNADTCKG